MHRTLLNSACLLLCMQAFLVRAQQLDMNQHFQPMMTRAMALEMSALTDKASCRAVAVAQVIDTKGELRIVPFGSDLAKPIGQAEAEIKSAAEFIAKLQAFTSVVTIFCRPAVPETATADGYIHVHFDHRNGYSTAEVVPYKFEQGGKVMLLPQVPGEPLRIFVKRIEPASGASSPLVSSGASTQ